MNYLENRQVRLKLANALVRKSINSSEMNKTAALRLRTTLAFRDELVKIDPSMEKLAWGWVPNWAKKAGKWAWDNKGAIGSGLLTAAMFVPGLNIAAGAGRAAMLGYRGYRAARGASSALRAARAVRGVTSAGRMANATRPLAMGPNMSRVQALRHGAGRAMSSPHNPLNRTMSLGGSTGTTWSGGLAREGSRTFFRGRGGTGLSNFSQLSKPMKVLRGAAVPGFMAADLYGGVSRTAQHVRDARNALTGGDQIRRGGGTQFRGTSAKMRSVTDAQGLR